MSESVLREQTRHELKYVFTPQHCQHVGRLFIILMPSLHGPEHVLVSLASNAVFSLFVAVWYLEKYKWNIKNGSLMFRLFFSLFTQHNVIPFLYDLLCSVKYKRKKKSVFVHAMKVSEVQCCFRPHSLSLKSVKNAQCTTYYSIIA